MAQNTISAIAGGRSQVEYVRVYARVIEGLEMPAEAIGWLATGAFGVPLRAAAGEGDDVNRRDVMRNTLVTALTSGIAVSGAVGDKLTAAAQRPDPTTADHLAGLAMQLREECLVRPISELVPLSANLVSLGERWLRAAPDRLRPAVGRAVADTMAVHWWFLVNTGRDAEAAVVQAKIMEAAATWEVPALAGNLLTRRSGLAIGAGDPLGAIRLADAARADHIRLSPAGTLLAATFEARARALTGDEEGLKRAVEAGQASHAEVDPAGERPWLRWISGPHLLMAGMTLRLLGEGVEAVGAYEQALTAVPADWTRDRASFMSTLAVARALGGDIEGATHDAERAAQAAGPSGTVVPLAEAGLTELARRSHLVPLREVLADHGLAVA